VGSYAMNSLTTGDYNTSIGASSAQALTTGIGNVLVGGSSGVGLTTANYNTLVGYLAGAGIVGGGDNTVIGHNAGFSGHNIITGLRNVLVGKQCHTNATDGADQIVMGYNVEGSADSNFTFGKAGTDSNIAFGATSISAPSDIRLKENIQDEKIGLDFINDLRPVTFQWKKAKDISSEMDLHDLDSDERVMNGKYNHGFIAQEVKAVIDNHNLKDGFGMWTESGNDNRQRVAEGALVSILVKSIQELSVKNEDLLARITTLENN